METKRSVPTKVLSLFLSVLMAVSVFSIALPGLAPKASAADAFTALDEAFQNALDAGYLSIADWGGISVTAGTITVTDSSTSGVIYNLVKALDAVIAAESGAYGTYNHNAKLLEYLETGRNSYQKNFLRALLPTDGVDGDYSRFDGSDADHRWHGTPENMSADETKGSYQIVARRDETAAITASYSTPAEVPDSVETTYTFTVNMGLVAVTDPEDGMVWAKYINTSTSNAVGKTTLTAEQRTDINYLKNYLTYVGKRPFSVHYEQWYNGGTTNTDYLYTLTAQELGADIDGFTAVYNNVSTVDVALQEHFIGRELINNQYNYAQACNSVAPAAQLKKYVDWIMANNAPPVLLDDGSGVEYASRLDYQQTDRQSMQEARARAEAIRTRLNTYNNAHANILTEKYGYDPAAFDTYLAPLEEELAVYDLQEASIAHAWLISNTADDVYTFTNENSIYYDDSAAHGYTAGYYQQLTASDSLEEGVTYYTKNTETNEYEAVEEPDAAAIATYYVYVPPVYPGLKGLRDNEYVSAAYGRYGRTTDSSLTYVHLGEGDVIKEDVAYFTFDGEEYNYAPNPSTNPADISNYYYVPKTYYTMQGVGNFVKVAVPYEDELDTYYEKIGGECPIDDGDLALLQSFYTKAYNKLIAVENQIAALNASLPADQQIRPYYGAITQEDADSIKAYKESIDSEVVLRNNVPADFKTPYFWFLGQLTDPIGGRTNAELISLVTVAAGQTQSPAEQQYTALVNAYNSAANATFRNMDQRAGGYFQKFIEYKARVFVDQVYAELYDRAAAVSKVTQADYDKNTSVAFENYYAVKADIEYQDWTSVVWARGVIYASSSSQNNNVIKTAIANLQNKHLRKTDSAHNYAASNVMTLSTYNTIAGKIEARNFVKTATEVANKYTLNNYTREAGAYRDFARRDDLNEDFTVSVGDEGNLQNTVYMIDKFLANDHFTELLGVDEKGYYSLSDFVKGLLVDNVFTDNIVSTLVALLFPMLTSLFEDTIPDLIETEVNRKNNNPTDNLHELAGGNAHGQIVIMYNGDGHDEKTPVSFMTYTSASNLYIYPATFGQYLKNNAGSVIPDKTDIGNWIMGGGNNWDNLDLDPGVWDPETHQTIHSFDAKDITRYFNLINDPSDPDNYDSSLPTKTRKLSWGIDTIKRSSYPDTHAGFLQYCDKKFEQTKKVLGVIFGSANPVLEALFTTNDLTLNTDNGNKRLLTGYGQSLKYVVGGDVTGTITNIQATVTIEGVDLYHNVWIPVLEALGVNGDLMDSTYVTGEYQVTGSNWSTTQAVKALLDPVYHLIETICADPIKSVCMLLPELCFHLMNRSLQKLVEAQKISLKIRCSDLNVSVTNSIINAIISVIKSALVNAIKFDLDIYLQQFLNLDKLIPFDLTNLNDLIQGILAKVVGTEGEGEDEHPKAVLHLPAINMATIMAAAGSGDDNKSTISGVTRYNMNAAGDGQITVPRRYLSSATSYQKVFYLILNYVLEAAKKPGFVTDVLDFVAVISGSEIDLPGIVYTLINGLGSSQDIIAAIVELFNSQTYRLKDMDWYNYNPNDSGGKGQLKLSASDFVYLRYGNDWTEGKAKYLYNNVDKIANDVFNMIDPMLLENYDGDAGKWLDSFINSMFTNEGIQGVIDLLVKLGFTLANNPNIAKLIRQQLTGTIAGTTTTTSVGTDLLYWFNDFGYQVLESEDFEEEYGDFFTLKTQSELGEKYATGEYIQWLHEDTNGNGVKDSGEYYQAFVYARERVKNKDAEEGDPEYVEYNKNDRDTYNETKLRAWPNSIKFAPDANGLGHPVLDADGKLQKDEDYANGGDLSNMKNLKVAALSDLEGGVKPKNADGEEYDPFIITLTANTKDFVKVYNAQNQVTQTYSAGNNVVFYEGVMDGDGSNKPSSRAVFTACFCELVGPLVPLISLLLTGGGLKLFGQLEIKGYESYNAAFLPLMEALGVTGLPTQAQLNQMSNPNQTFEGSAGSPIRGFNFLVNRLFISLTDILRDDRVYDETTGEYVSGKGGFQKIVDMLPHLFYFLQSGGLSNVIRNLLAFAWTLVDTIRPVVDLDLDQVVHVVLWRLLGCCYDENDDDYRVDTVVTELFDLLGITAVPYNKVKEAADKKKVDAIKGISLATLDLAQLYPLVEALIGLDLRPLVYCFEGMCVRQTGSSNGVTHFTRVNGYAQDTGIYTTSVYYQPSRKGESIPATQNYTNAHAFTLNYAGADIITVTLSAILDLLNYKDNAINLDKLIGLTKERIPGGERLLGNTSASGILDALELIFEDRKHSSKLDRPNWDYLLEGKYVEGGGYHNELWDDIMGEGSTLDPNPSTNVPLDWENWQALVDFAGTNGVDMSRYHTLYNLDYTTDWTSGTAKGVVETLDNILDYVAKAVGGEADDFETWINDFLNEKVFNADIVYLLVSYLAKAYDLLPEGIRKVIDKMFGVNMSGWEEDEIVIGLTPSSIAQLYSRRNEVSKVKYTVTTYELASVWEEGRIYYTKGGTDEAPEYTRLQGDGTLKETDFRANTYYYKNITVEEKDHYVIRDTASRIEVDEYAYGYADDQYVDEKHEQLIENPVKTYHVDNTIVYRETHTGWHQVKEKEDGGELVIDEIESSYSANDEYKWFTGDAETNPDYVHDRATFLAALKEIVHSADKLFGYIFLEDDYRILYSVADDLEENENSQNHANDEYDITDAITVNGVGLYSMLVIPVLEALGVPLTREAYNKLVNGDEAEQAMAAYYANAYTGDRAGITDYGPDKYYQPLFFKSGTEEDPVTSFVDEDGSGTTWVPYKDNQNNRKYGYNTNEWVDDMFIIFEDFFNVVLADPLEWVLDVLPGLIYFINSSGFTTAIRNTLGAVQDLLDMINNILRLSKIDERIGMVIGGIDLNNTTLSGLFKIVVNLINKDKEGEEESPKFHVNDEILQVCRDMFIGKLTTFTSANGFRSFTMSYNEVVTGTDPATGLDIRTGEGKRDMITILVSLLVELLTDKGTFVDEANGYKTTAYDNAAALGAMIGSDYQDLISEVVSMLRNPGELNVAYKDINWDYFDDTLQLAAREENTGKEVNIDVPRFAFQYLNYTTAWKYENAVTTVDGLEGLILAVLGMVDEEQYGDMTSLGEFINVDKFFTAETAQTLLDLISNLIYGEDSIIAALAGVVGAVLGADLTEWDYTYQFVSKEMADEAVAAGATLVNDTKFGTTLKCYDDVRRKQIYVPVADDAEFDPDTFYFNHVTTYVPVEIGEFADGVTYYYKDGSIFREATEYSGSTVYYTMTESWKSVSFKNAQEFAQKREDEELNLHLEVMDYEVTTDPIVSYVIDCSENKNDFASAIAIILRPAGQLLAWLLFDDPYEFFVGNTESTHDDVLLTIPGANGYEKGLVLLLEALGLRGLGYASRYTADVNGKYLFLQDLSKSIVARLDEILASPVSELVALIPELIYFINANGLAVVINNLLAGPLALVAKVPSALKLVSDSNFDMSTLFTEVEDGEAFDPSKQYFTLVDGEYVAQTNLAAFGDATYYYLDATRVIDSLVSGLLNSALSEQLDKNGNEEVDDEEMITFSMDNVNLGWIMDLVEKITGLEITDLLQNELENFYIGKVKSYASMSRTVAYKMEFDDRGFKNGGNGDRGDFLTILLSFAIDLLCYVDEANGKNNAVALATLIDNEKVSPDLLASIVKFIHGNFTVEYSDYDWFYFDENYTLYEMEGGKIRRKTETNELTGETEPKPYHFDQSDDPNAVAAVIPLNSFNYLTYESDWTEETAKYLTDHRNEIIGAVLKLAMKSDATPAELLSELFDPAEKIYTAEVLNSILEPIKGLVGGIDETLLNILGIVLDIDLSVYNHMDVLYGEVTYTKEAISAFEQGVQYYTAVYTPVPAEAEFDENTEYFTKNDQDKYVAAKDLKAFAEGVAYYTRSYVAVAADAAFSAAETYYVKHERNFETNNFEEGSRDAFVARLTEMLLPLSPILDWLLFGKNLQYFDKKVSGLETVGPGTPEQVEVLIDLKGAEGYKYGLIPLLEALGVTIPTVAQGEELNTQNILAVLINNVLARMEAIFASPVDEVLNLLPELLYFINANGLATAVHNLLAGVYGLVSEVASTGALNSLLDLPEGEEVDISSVISDLLADLGVSIDIEKLDLVSILGIVKDLTNVKNVRYDLTTDTAIDEAKTYYTLNDEGGYDKVKKDDLKEADLNKYYEEIVVAQTGGIDLISFCEEKKIDEFYFGKMIGYLSGSGQLGFKMVLTEEQDIHDLLTFVVNLALEFLMDETNAKCIDALISKDGIDETGEPAEHTVGAIVRILKGLKDLDQVDPETIDWDYFLTTGELSATGVTMPESQFVYLDYSNLWTKELANGLGERLTGLINEILALTAKDEPAKTIDQLISELVDIDSLLTGDLLNTILDFVAPLLYGEDAILNTELLNLIGLVLGADLTQWNETYRFEKYDETKTYETDDLTGLKTRETGEDAIVWYESVKIDAFKDGVTYYTADEVEEGAEQTYTVADTYDAETKYFIRKTYTGTVYAIANANEFADGLALVLQPAQKLLGWLLLGDDYRFFVEKANGNLATKTDAVTGEPVLDPVTGEPVYIRDDKELLVVPGFNGYDMSLVLLLEALGCEGLKPASDYEDNEAALIKDVIKALVARVNAILANPIDNILDLIPELIYFVNAGGLNAVVMNLAGGLLKVVDYINDSGLITDDEGNPKPISVSIDDEDVLINSSVIDTLVTNVLNKTEALVKLLDEDDDGVLTGTERLTFKLKDVNVDWIINIAEKLTGLDIHDAVGSTYALSKLMLGSVERYDSASTAYNSDSTPPISLTYRIQRSDENRGDVITILLSLVLDALRYKDDTHNNAAKVAEMLEGVLDGAVTEDVINSAIDILAGGWEVTYATPDWYYCVTEPHTPVEEITEDPHVTLVGHTINYLTYGSNWTDESVTNLWTEDTAKFVVENFDAVLADVLKIMKQDEATVADLLKGAFDPAEKLYTAEMLNKIVGLVKDLPEKLGESIVEIFGLVLDIHLEEYVGMTFTEETITDRESFIDGLVTVLGPIYTVLDWLLFGKDLAFLYDNDFYNKGMREATELTAAEGFKPGTTYYTLSYVQVPAAAAFDENARYFTREGDEYTLRNIEAFEEGTTYYVQKYTKATAYAAGTKYYTDLGGSLINIKGGMGYANAIVPLFEALGIAMPAADQMDDVALKTVLTRVFNKLDTILADPVGEALDLLPNLLYFLNANGVSVVVGNLLASVLGLADAAAPIIVKFIGSSITLSKGEDEEDPSDDVVIELMDGDNILPTKDIINNLINGLLRDNGINVTVDYQDIDLLAAVEVIEAATGMKIQEVLKENAIPSFYIGKIEYKPYADGRAAFYMSYLSESDAAKREERHDMLTILVNLVAEILLYKVDGTFVNVEALCGLVPQIAGYKDMILEVIELLTNPEDYEYNELNWNYFKEDAVLGEEIAVPKSDFIYLAYKNDWTFEKAVMLDAGLKDLVDDVIKLVKKDDTATLASLLGDLVDLDEMIAKPDTLNKLLDLLKKYLYGEEAVLGESLLNLIGLLFNAELTEWNDVYEFEAADAAEHPTYDADCELSYRVETKTVNGKTTTKLYYGIATLEDFVNGLYKILSPAGDLLAFLLLGDSYGFFTDSKTGEKVLLQIKGAKGYANGLALLLEALGVKGLQSDYESGAQLLKDVLGKLVLRVREILANPIDEVLALLTELIYFINANGLKVVVKNLAGAAFNIIEALEKAGVAGTATVTDAETGTETVVNNKILDVDSLINGLLTDALGVDLGFSLDGINIQWIVDTVEAVLSAKMDITIDINGVIDDSLYEDYPLETLAIGKAVPYDSVTDKYLAVPSYAVFDDAKTYYTMTEGVATATLTDAFEPGAVYYTKSANNYKMIFGDGTEEGGASRADMITILLSFVLDFLRNPTNQDAIESITDNSGEPIMAAGTIAQIIDIISGYEVEITPKKADWFYFDETYTVGTDIQMPTPSIQYLSYASDWTEELADFLDDNLEAIIAQVFEIIDKDKPDDEKLISIANIIKTKAFDPNEKLYTAENLNKIALAIANLVKGLQQFILDTIHLVLDVDLSAYKEMCVWDEATEKFTSCTYFTEDNYLLATTFDAEATYYVKSGEDAYVETAVADAEAFAAGTFYVKGLGREGFVSGLRMLLEPIFPVLDWLLFGDSFKFFNRISNTAGDEIEDLVVVTGYEGYAYGLLPLLEAILLPVGVTLPDCSDPTAATYDTEHMIGAVLSNVLFGLEKILADPVENALKLIPNLLYFINANGLCVAVNHLIGAPLALIDKAVPLVRQFAGDSIKINDDLSIALTDEANDNAPLTTEEIVNKLINGLLASKGVEVELNIKDLRLVDVLAVVEAFTGLELTDFVVENGIENFYVGQITLNRTKDDPNRGADEVYRSNGRGDAISFRMEYSDDVQEDRADLITVLVNYLIEAALYGDNARALDILISKTDENGNPNKTTVETIINMLSALATKALPGDYHWNYFNEDSDSDTPNPALFTITLPATPFNNHLRYSTDWTQTTANALYENIDDVVTAILTIIAKGDANKATTVAELISGNFNLFSAEILNKLTDLIQKLYENFDASLVSLIGTVLGCNEINVWYGLHFEDGEVYDAETFKEGIYRIVSPLSRVLDWLLFGQEYGFFVEDKNAYPADGATHGKTLINIGGADGYLFGLAQILLALGVELPEYAAGTTCSTVMADGRTFLRTVLDAVVDRVAAILNDPVDEALALLPGLLYFINANGVSTAAYNMAGGVLEAIKVLVDEGLIELKKDGVVYDSIEAYLAATIGVDIRNLDLEGIIGILESKNVTKGIQINAVFKGEYTVDDETGDVTFTPMGTPTDGEPDNRENILEKFYCGVMDTYDYGEFHGWKMVAAEGKKGDILTMLLSIVLDVLYYEDNEEPIAALINSLLKPEEGETKFSAENFRTLKALLQTGADFTGAFQANWTYYIENNEEWVDMIANDPVEALTQLVEEGLPPMKVRTARYLEYDNNWNKDTVDYLDRNLNDIVDLVINLATGGDYPDLEKLIEGKLDLYTADMFNKIVNKLAGLISKLDEILTKELQNSLVTAAGSLLGLNTEFEDGKTLLEVVCEPVTDDEVNDKASFVQAFVDHFSPLNRVLDWLLFNKSYTFFHNLTSPNETDAEAMIVLKGGEGYKYGLAPILAALGVDTEIESTSCADGALSEVLTKVADRIDELLYGGYEGHETKALDEVLALLPELIYFINTGAVSNCIMNLLQPADELLSIVNENIDNGNLIQKNSVADFIKPFSFNGNEYTLRDIGFDFIFDIVADKLDIDIANATGVSADGVALGKVGDYIKSFYFGQLEYYESYGGLPACRMNYVTSDEFTAEADTRMDMLTILVTLVLDVFTSRQANEAAIVKLLGGGDSEEQLAKGQRMYDVIYNFLSGDLITVDYQKFNWLHTQYADTGIIVSPMTSDGSIVNQSIYGPLYTRPMGEYMTKYLQLAINTYVTLLGLKINGKKVFTLEDILQELVGSNIYKNDYLNAIYQALKNLLTKLREETLGEELYEHIAYVLKNATINPNNPEDVGVDLNYWFEEYEGPDEIEEGNQEQFIAEICKMLRPAYPVLRWLLADDSIAFFNKATGADQYDEYDEATFEAQTDNDYLVLNGAEGYRYGILPILEALCNGDTTNILSYTEYLAADAEDSTGDSLLKNILKPILCKVDDILADPINGVLDLLPAVVYFMGSNGLDTCFKNLLGSVFTLLANIDPLIEGVDKLHKTDANGNRVVSLYPLIGLDLEAVNLETLVRQLLDSLKESTGFALSDLGVELVNELSLGVVESYDSKINTEDFFQDMYTMKYAEDGTDVEGNKCDKVDMVTILLRLVLTFISDPDNKDKVEAMLKDKVSEDGYTFLCSLLDNFSIMVRTPDGKDKVMYTIYYVFYSALVAGVYTNNAFAEFNGNYSFLSSLFNTSDLAFFRAIGNSMKDIFHMTDSEGNEIISPIIDESGVVPQGQIPFWQKIIEFFKQIIAFFKNLFK